MASAYSRKKVVVSASPKGRNSRGNRKRTEVMVLPNNKSEQVRRGQGTEGAKVPRLEPGL